MSRNPDCLKYNDCLNRAARFNQTFYCEKCSELQLPTEDGFKRYVNEIQGDVLTTLTVKKEDKIMPYPRSEERFCKICGEKEQEKLVSSAVAYKGLKMICKECEGKKKREAYIKRTKGKVKVRREKEKAPALKPTPLKEITKPIKPVTERTRPTVTVDFRNRPDVLEKVDMLAREEDRSISSQIVNICKRFLEREAA